MEPYVCEEVNAAKIHGWLLHRGGILIWRSVNLSNPGQTWTSPALTEDGKEYTKPNWQCDSKPERHIVDIAEVSVATSKEVKRFHVAVLMGGNGMQLKLTDGASRKLRAEVEKAHEKYAKPAWYWFDDYSEENCVIMIDSETVPMADWVANQL